MALSQILHASDYTSLKNIDAKQFEREQPNGKKLLKIEKNSLQNRLVDYI